MSRQVDEATLWERLNKMIPKSLKDKGYTIVDIVEDVECDDIDGGDGYDPSYWVYLNDGFVSEHGMGSHTLHEDTLKELKKQMSRIVEKEE